MFFLKKTKKVKPSLGEIIKASSLPRQEAELLLSYLIGRDKIFIMTHPEFCPEDKIPSIYRKLEKKRLKNWPIAYLIGKKEFFGRDFELSTATLVPRPETETMVEDILKESIINKKSNYAFFDIGTGSGAIIVSLAAELKEKNISFYNQSIFTAVDISKKALLIAKKNAKKYFLDEKIIFKKSNLLKSIGSDLQKAITEKRQIIIAANLPYLKPEEMKEKSIKREPKNALLSGLNGLKHYEKMFSQLRSIKDIKSARFLIYCEINPDQSNEINKLAEKNFPQTQISFIKDLSNKNRFCLIKNIP